MDTVVIIMKSNYSYMVPEQTSLGTIGILFLNFLTVFGR